ncbi:hypothetical protein BJ165DRAFT_1406071 [Panaeolus papilionaceus]|nr:hypothetical protein BJ165DRAFT_1406071 [Panaeolus papilionaceus]
MSRFCAAGFVSLMKCPRCTGANEKSRAELNWNISFSSPPDGPSTDACAEDYKGQSPNNAPEVKGLAHFIDDKAREGPGAVIYVDWHSSRMLFMYSYGYDWAKTPSTADATEFDSLVQGFARNVDDCGVHNARYITGPICTTIYPTSGHHQTIRLMFQKSNTHSQPNSGNMSLKGSYSPEPNSHIG